MPTEINREDVQRLLQEEAQLIEVLPAAQYEQTHLVQAINIPLERLNRESVRQLQQDQALITYCADSL